MKSNKLQNYVCILDVTELTVPLTTPLRLDRRQFFTLMVFHLRHLLNLPLELHRWLNLKIVSCHLRRFFVNQLVPFLPLVANIIAYNFAT